MGVSHCQAPGVRPLRRMVGTFKVLDGREEIRVVLGSERGLVAAFAGPVVEVCGGAQLHLVVLPRVYAVVEVKHLRLELIDQLLHTRQPVQLEDL